jgi:hypothetical protein
MTTTMSTGTNGNGLDTPTEFTASVLSASAGLQLSSAAWNGVEDRIQTVSQEHADTAELAQVGAGCSFNTDGVVTPQVDAGGGRTVDLAVITDGANEVVIDDSIDWRQRLVTIFLSEAQSATPEDSVPGGANEALLIWLYSHADMVHKLAYTHSGTDSSAFPTGTLHVAAGSGTDDLVLYVGNESSGHPGALLCTKTSASDDEFVLVGRVSAGPRWDV